MSQKIEINQKSTKIWKFCCNFAKKNGVNLPKTRKNAQQNQLMKVNKVTIWVPATWYTYPKILGVTISDTVNSWSK